MKFDRSKNAARNVTYGILLKFVTMFCPFIMRTIVLYIMGAQYLGLSSLFSSVLQVLSLAELGVGTAMIYSMYKPIAEDDEETICALLNLYRAIYAVIGCVMLVAGVAVIPFLRFLVKGTHPPDINLYILYGIYLFNSVISYFMYAYKQCLLNASQRNDIISKRSMVIQLSMYIAQGVTLLLTHDYYMFIILLPISTIATNIANAVITDKLFPEYKCRGKVNGDIKKSIIKKTSALIGTKLNSVVLHAADTLVISAFAGLTATAIYGNYYYIMNTVISIVAVIYSSITPGIGNSIEAESVEKNYRDFQNLSFANSWLVAFCATCLLCLYQPFMEIWVKEDALLYPMGIVVLFVVYFYIYQIRKVVLTYKDAAGIWWEDRFRPYVMMAVNLIGNIILIQLIGIYGVVLSTIISMVISIPWENYTIFKFVFKRSARQYYISMGGHFLVSLIVCAMTYWVCGVMRLQGIYGVFARLAICVLIPNAVFFAVYRKKPEYAQLKKWIRIMRKRILRGR